MDYQKYRNIPNRLRMYRRIIGLSQKQVGERLGIDPDWVSHWENGDTLPNLISAFRLASIYQVPVDTLFADLWRKISEDP